MDKRLTNKERNLLNNFLHINHALLEEIEKLGPILSSLEDHSPILHNELFNGYKNRIEALKNTAGPTKEYVKNILIKDKLHSQIMSCNEKIEKDLKKCSSKKTRS